MTWSRDLPPPACALAFGAHADDIEFGGAGTLAKWTAAGTEVHLCILTDGSKGSWEPGADTAELVATRRHEQRAAADVLGAKAVHFLDFVDGELEDRVEHREVLSDVIREVRPDVVLAHDPWKRYRLHPDHRAAGLLTIGAIVAARDPHFLPGRGTPHRPGILLLFEAEKPDHLEDVANHLDQKIEALLAHKSQWENTLAIDPTNPDTESFAQKIRDEARAAATGTTLNYAEAFKKLTEL